MHKKLCLPGNFYDVLLTSQFYLEKDIATNHLNTNKVILGYSDHPRDSKNWSLFKGGRFLRG